MRTTVTFDDDTAAAVEALRHERGLGVSAAVNELIRHGLAAPQPCSAFVQRTSPGHARLDVTDVADTLELLDGSATSR